MEGIAWKIRNTKNGMKTRLRFDDGARGLKLMVKSPGANMRWKQASKILVGNAERYVKVNGGKKRKREDATSPSSNYVPVGRRRHQQSPERRGNGGRQDKPRSDHEQRKQKKLVS